MTEQKQESSTMVCDECGTETDESANFCAKCGARIEKKAETATSADDNNDATKDARVGLPTLDKFVAYIVLAVIGIPLALWLNDHFTERQQVEKVVAKAPIKREREVPKRQRRGGETIEERVAQAQEKAREANAVFIRRLKRGEHCSVLRDGARVLQLTREFNRRMRDAGLNAHIPEDELRSILKVAKAGC